MCRVGDVAAYVEGLPPDARAALERVCGIVHRVSPEADEGTSYGMPAFRVAGKPLLGMQATAKHLALYPFSPDVVAAVAGRLEGWSLSKGTIRFTATTPLPDDVIEDVVRLRRAEIG